MSWLIPLLLGALVLLGIVGWLHSRRTRRNVIFALLVLLVLAVLLGAFALARRYWFPLPPF